MPTGSLAPRYARLSGEIADQAVLDGLRAAYPQAIVAHAFASTEAGVAFEVRDGRAGFPAVAGRRRRGARRAAGGRGDPADPLRGHGQRYLGGRCERSSGPDGFVDTGDRVEVREGRYYFMGRRGGVINVGGMKVHPEEVEAVINTHPWVRMSLVKARRNPITGAVVDRGRGAGGGILRATGRARRRPNSCVNSPSTASRRWPPTRSRR